MKRLLLRIALTLSALALGACAFLYRLDEVHGRYAQVTEGMSEQEVVTRLGPPHERKPGGLARWRVEYDPRNYVELALQFDEAGIVRRKSLIWRDWYVTPDLKSVEELTPSNPTGKRAPTEP